MLEVTFPYIVYEELREVHLAILKRHPNIPQPFLRQLGANSELYALLPLPVQRQIWQVSLKIQLKLFGFLSIFPSNAHYCIL